MRGEGTRQILFNFFFLKNAFVRSFSCLKLVFDCSSSTESQSQILLVLVQNLQQRYPCNDDKLYVYFYEHITCQCTVDYITPRDKVRTPKPPVTCVGGDVVPD